MSLFDSFKHHKDSKDEEDFERAFREGRYPEGVDDFQPLSTTGNFVAPGLEQDAAPYAPVADDASGARDDRADRDAWSAPSRDDYVSTIDDDMDGVQVYERGSAPSRPAVGVNPVTPAGSRSFRDRFQDKVVAANVAGWQDEGIGRSKARTLADETRPPASVRNAPSADVSGKDLEAELAARRRESEVARAEREQARSRAQGSGAPAPASASAAPAAPGARADAPRPAAPAPALSLPATPTVLRVRAYDDVSEIARSIMERRQPVVLLMRGTSSEITRRVLDFSFGLCCGCSAEMSELEDRVYCVLPRGVTIGDHEKAVLRRQGILLRG